MTSRTPKIALEEHFLAPGFEEYFETTAINISPDLFGLAYDALRDFDGRRIEAMDAVGVELSILSLAGPGVQVERSSEIAIRKARDCNDFLAEKMAAQPRFGGLAHFIIIIAHRYAPASLLAPFYYTQIVWSVLAGFLMFGDIPDHYTILGAAVVISGGLYLMTREARARRKGRR